MRQVFEILSQQVHLQELSRDSLSLSNERSGDDFCHLRKIVQPGKPYTGYDVAVCVRLPHQLKYGRDVGFATLWGDLMPFAGSLAGFLLDLLQYLRQKLALLTRDNYCDNK